MTANSAVGSWSLRIVLILCATLVGSLCVAAANQSSDLGVSSGTPSSDGGGIVVSTVTPEPQPTRDDPGIILPTATPGSVEATPTFDALAPGSVTVVLHTSDGNPTASRTMVCVEDICQPADGLASGTKVMFDRVPSGWLGVTVRSDDTYESTSSSVKVVQGQLSHLDLTLRLIRPVDVVKVDVTPPVNQMPNERDPNPISQGNALNDSAMSEPNVPASGITQLPATGIGPDVPSRISPFSLLLPVVVGLSAAFIGLLTMRSRHR